MAKKGASNVGDLHKTRGLKGNVTEGACIHRYIGTYFRSFICTLTLRRTTQATDHILLAKQSLFSYNLSSTNTFHVWYPFDLHHHNLKIDVLNKQPEITMQGPSGTHSPPVSAPQTDLLWTNGGLVKSKYFAK